MLFAAAWSLLVVLPLLLLFIYSFLQTRGFRIEWTFTLENWASLAKTGRWIVVLRTLKIALTITAIELVVALPFAFWLAKVCASKSLKATVLALVTIPFFLDISSRTVIWRAILGSQGLLNSALIHLGIVDEPLEWLLFSEFAIHFGMLAPYFPTMLLPIYLVLELVDREYMDASHDLGATPIMTFFFVVLPLAMPGVIAGILFTLVPTMADYVIPWLLGGFKVVLLGTSVESALSALKYPTAAALSTIVIGILALFLAVLLAALRRVGDPTAVFSLLRR